MRFFVAGISWTPYNGAEAGLWAAKQKPESLSSRIKYRSNCTVFGRRYVGEEKLGIEDKDADNLYNQMEELYKQFKKNSGCKMEQNGTHCNGKS